MRPASVVVSCEQCTTPTRMDKRSVGEKKCRGCGGKLKLPDWARRR